MLSKKKKNTDISLLSTSSKMCLRQHTIDQTSDQNRGLVNMYFIQVIL